ncbi:MAG: hypothetical protein F2809_04890 [Actinobacteria bacterium]|nr:hypothetical protein [Actinomycetota bacterium]
MSRQVSAERARDQNCFPPLERGAVVPTMLVICCLSAVCVVGLVHIGEAAVQRARADAVADVVALAAVGHGDDGAEKVSRAAGAELLNLRRVGPTAVQVSVMLNGARSSAAADALGDELPPERGSKGNPESEFKPR